MHSDPFIAHGRSRGRGRALMLAIWVIAVSGGPFSPAGGADPTGSPAFPAIDDATLEKLLQQHYQERESVQMVLLSTSVTDRRGRLVRGLEQKDFRLYEDGQPQEIAFLASEASEPISLAFMLDLSGSMRQQDKLERAKRAIRHIVERLDSRDSVALIGFTDEQVAWITEFTNDRQRFLMRLEVQRAYGQTALNDAVAAAPDLVRRESRGRAAILLFTDGADNSSVLTMDQAVGLSRRVNVPIYAVGFLAVPEKLRPRGSTLEPVRVLERVTDETGGRLFAIDSAAELDAVVGTLDAELRQQYVIGFYPSATDGEFHPISLETHKRRLSVRTRSGYIARP